MSFKDCRLVFSRVKFGNCSGSVDPTIMKTRKRRKGIPFQLLLAYVIFSITLRDLLHSLKKKKQFN